MHTDASLAHCPQCGHQLSSDPRYITWCDRCDWNVDPTPAERFPEPTWRLEQEQRLAGTLSRELERGAVHSPGWPPARASAFLLALPILVLPLPGLIGGLALLVFYRPVWLGIVLAAIVLTLTAAFRPRVIQLPPGAQLVARDSAPHLYDVLDRLTTATGTPPIRAVAVTTEPVISVDRIGWRYRRTLQLGMPLWSGLNPQERIAAVAHEAYDDKLAIHEYVVRGAREILGRLNESFRPGPLDEVRYDVVRRASGNDLVIVGTTDDQVVNYYLTKFANAVFGPPVRGYRRLLDRLNFAGRQRTEYLNDRKTAELAGSEAAAGALERSLLADTTYRALERAIRFNTGIEPLEALRHSAATTPQHELNRRIRLSQLHNTRSDATHPPTHLRTTLLRQSPTPATFTLTPAASSLIDQELSTPAQAAVDELRPPE